MLGLVVAGCATLSEKQCASGDWQGIGYRDGFKGETANEILKHQEACAEYGIRIKEKEYEAGRRKGLESYCQPSNGFRVGKQGGSYRSVCPADLEGPFLKKYHSGLETYRTEKELKQVYDEIARVEANLESEGDATRRKSLLREVHELRVKKDTLQRKLTVLEIKGS